MPVSEYVFVFVFVRERERERERYFFEKDITYIDRNCFRGKFDLYIIVE